MKRTPTPSAVQDGLPWNRVLFLTIMSNLLMLQLYRLWSFPSASTNPVTDLNRISIEWNDVTEEMDVSENFRLAYDQSFGFFSDITNSDWIQFYQIPVQKAQHYRYPSAPMKGARYSAQWNFFNWDRYFNCPHVRKIGGLGDHAKWVCDIERVTQTVERRKRRVPDAECLVYSFGSRGRYRFELALHVSLGIPCEIHIFDIPTEGNYPDWNDKNIHFHPWELRSSYSSDYQKNEIEGRSVIPFRDILGRLGHENRTIDILKIDCKSCEWYSFPEWIGADIRQLILRTNDLPLPYVAKGTEFGLLPAINGTDLFDKLLFNYGFVLFAKEADTQGGFGRSVDWSFLKLRMDFFAGVVNTN